MIKRKTRIAGGCIVLVAAVGITVLSGCQSGGAAAGIAAALSDSSVEERASLPEVQTVISTQMEPLAMETDSSPARSGRSSTSSSDAADSPEAAEASETAPITSAPSVPSASAVESPPTQEAAPAPTPTEV